MPVPCALTWYLPGPSPTTTRRRSISESTASTPCVHPASGLIPYARQYYTSDWGGSHFDNWFVADIPTGALCAGRNEILLWSDSVEPGWEIMVAADGEYARGSRTRFAHPDRSAKSRDGGKTWDSNRLGWKDEIDGEYCVRLSLQRYAQSGVYVSPVIDLAGQSGIKIFCAYAKVIFAGTWSCPMSA